MGLVTESDTGPLSSTYRDSELLEDKKAERLHVNLVSPESIWRICRDPSQAI